MKMNRNEVYTGPLADEIIRYLALKRSVGNAYNDEAKRFMRFDDFSKDFDTPPHVLTQELVLAWCEKRPHEKPLNQSKRIHAIKRFATYLNEHGYVAYIYPYPVPCSAESYIPHIFTKGEIAKLIKLSDEYQATPTSPYLNLTVPLAFRVLYGCGLRTSELLSLKVKDVDFTNGTLHITNSKFGKSRIVPMAPSLTEYCEKYLEARYQSYNDNSYLFANARGGKYTPCSIYYWFRALLMKAEIPHYGKGHGPRVHDIRHTFAVHCLKKWSKNGQDISALLPILSTYMGHCDLRGTQIYLHLTPEAFPDVIEKMETYYEEKRR